MAGQVRVEGQTALKPGAAIDSGAEVTVEKRPRFVSRGGEKLDAALAAFDLDVRGRLCADVGASTGGFTDCLLQRGARKVYAIDVGKGILHWKMRTDARVIVMEQTNARFVRELPEPVSLVTIDASFISLRILLPVVKLWLPPGAENAEPRMPAAILALIKPQFEAGKKDVARGRGVIRAAEIHEHVLREVLDFGQSEGLGTRGLLKSPLVGPKGNVEFLVWFDLAAQPADTGALIEQALGRREKSHE